MATERKSPELKLLFTVTPNLSKARSDHLFAGKAKRRHSFWAVAPFLNMVTVLTPATM